MFHGCQHGLRVNVPNAYQLPILRANVPVNVLTCQRCANFKTCRVNVRKACQVFNFACQKAYQFFNYFSDEFLNFWIYQSWSVFANLKNIWPILEKLSCQTQNLQNLMKEKPYQPKTFDVVFNQARGINQEVTRLM